MHATVWLVREQVAMAALDVGDMGLATGCVKAISRQFPDSMRAHRLQASAVLLCPRFCIAGLCSATCLLILMRRIANFASDGEKQG
jgi:hypothetical protein